MELKTIDLGQGIYLFKNVFKDKEKAYKFILDSKRARIHILIKKLGTTGLHGATTPKPIQTLQI